jgi:hypothetical protein
LAEQLEHGAGSGNEVEDAVLGGMEAALGIAEGGGFAGADLAGDDCYQMGVESVIEALQECIQAGEWEELIDGDLLGEGFGAEAECVGE